MEPTYFDKLATNYLASIQFALIRLWLRIYCVHDLDLVVIPGRLLHHVDHAAPHFLQRAHRPVDLGVARQRYREIELALLIARDAARDAARQWQPPRQHIL